MTIVNSIPTNRASELLIGQKLLAQLRFDQSNLFRLQNQIATGRRLERPSDDAAAAQRGFDLQRLLEQKSQAEINVNTNLSFLAASDAALSGTSNLLSRAKGLAQAAVGASPQERAAAAIEIRQILEQLLDTGNQQFRDRYLFGGTRTEAAPFSVLDDGKVLFEGNSGALRSFADIDLLFETNIPATEVIGGLSSGVQGTADLNPILTTATRLSDLRSGKGVVPGSIILSDGSSNITIDLSKARTIGDVIRALESNPPTGRTVRVDLSAVGLEISLDTAGGGHLTINESAGGTTAKALGILKEFGNGTLNVSGSDLDPVLTPTTLLDDILGVRASALVQMPDANNDLFFRAGTRGSDFNGVNIHFVDTDSLQAGPGLPGVSVVYNESATAAQVGLEFAGPNNDVLLAASQAGVNFNNVKIEITSSAAPGAESANYNAGTKTLRIDLAADGSSTGNSIITAIANEASGAFIASLDDSLDIGNDGNGTIGAISNLNFANTGNSGGNAKTLFVRVRPATSTANDVVGAVNAEGTFRAEIDSHDSASVAASGTGLIDLSVTAVTDGGDGIEFDQTAGLRVVQNEDVTEVSLASAKTIEDAINIINGSETYLMAELNSSRTGLNIHSRLSGASFSIGENAGSTATHLGIRSLTEDTRLDGLNRGTGVHRVEGTDFIVRRRDGVELEIDISSASTIRDVLDAINNHPDNAGSLFPVEARLVAVGNGIEIVHDEPNGTVELAVIQPIRGTEIQAAHDLGLVPKNPEQLQSDPPLPALPSAANVQLTGANNDFRIESAKAGELFNDVNVVIVNNAAVGDVALVSYNTLQKTLTIDVDPASTRSSTVVQEINNQGDFSAVLDSNSEPGNDGSGLVTETGTVAVTAGGRAEILAGVDPNRQEVRGSVDALLRIAEVLETDDHVELQRALAILEESQEQLTFARAELGARQQGLATLQSRLESEKIDLRSALSTEIDVDLVAAISEISARQVSFQASLQTAGLLAQISLLDFL